MSSGPEIPSVALAPHCARRGDGPLEGQTPKGSAEGLKIKCERAWRVRIRAGWNEALKNGGLKINYWHDKLPLPPPGSSHLTTSSWAGREPPGGQLRPDRIPDNFPGGETSGGKERVHVSQSRRDRIRGDKKTLSMKNTDRIAENREEKTTDRDLSEEKRTAMEEKKKSTPGKWRIEMFFRKRGENRPNQTAANKPARTSSLCNRNKMRPIFKRDAVCVAVPWKPWKPWKP